MEQPQSIQAQLASYFNGVGFDRWSAIYGDAPLSRIRRTVREGHRLMLTQAETWLNEDHTKGSLLDAGCGTGLFSLQMAAQGYDVVGIDIAPRMVSTAAAAAQQANLEERTQFLIGQLEDVRGSFETVACLDVLVHYPTDAFVALCHHLAERSQRNMIITYAPYNRLLAGMHWIGRFFPQGQRRTEIQMIPDRLVQTTLAAAGMKIKRTVSISRGFYHVKLLQAQRNL